MQILLATGIYPPAIGGPATYSFQLAKELASAGHDVAVITYAPKADQFQEAGWKVIKVKLGLPILRWFSYARALKKYGKDADIVYAFSSVSCGVPLMIAKLKKPKKFLRLGGDFLWERATDGGNQLTLAQWYACEESFRFAHFLMERLLATFDAIVFSTEFQKRLYEQHYNQLPHLTVIENALPQAEPILHARNEPLHYVFMGRFVRFKNLPNLLQAIARAPDVSLTLVGEGPMQQELQSLIDSLRLTDRIQIQPAIHGKQKHALFDAHDILILPSLTEISPNTALEARAAGLPVLLTRETGLSQALVSGMQTANLLTTDDIVAGMRTMETGYESIAAAAAHSLAERSWQAVAHDHISAFEGLLSS